MTIILAILAFLAALSFSLGFYFRVAEYDILASDRVWDRIVPASQQIVDDGDVPNEIAAVVTIFSMMTGCGCFVNALLWETIKRKLGLSKAPSPSNSLEKQVASLSDETRHTLFKLMSDLVLFDSLHAPILGRLCRVLHRKRFLRSRYRYESASREHEELTIVRITRTAEALIASKGENIELSRELQPS